MADILIVDAVEAQAAATARLLADYGLASSVVDTAHAAPAAARARRPDPILMDAFMPEMDGFHVTRQITRDPELADIPVVMLAAPTHSAHKVRALWYGARELIFRPLDDLAVREVVLPLIGPQATVLRAVAG